MQRLISPFCSPPRTHFPAASSHHTQPMLLPAPCWSCIVCL